MVQDNEGSQVACILPCNMQFAYSTCYRYVCRLTQIHLLNTTHVPKKQC